MTKQRSVLMRGLRILRSYIRTHPVPFTVSVTGAAVYAAMTVASAWVLGRVTDHVLVPAFGRGVRGSQILFWGVAAVMAVALVRSAGIITRRYYAGMTGARVQVTLREAVVDKYRDLPLAYHRSHPTGELLAHVEADVMAATEVIHPLPYTLAVLLLIVFAVVSLMLTDPFLGLIGVLLLPGVAFLNRFYTRRVEGPSNRVQQRMGDVAAVAHESFDGALVVKTLGREADEVKRLSEKAEQLRRERVYVGEMRSLFEPALDALPNLGMIVLLGVGAWRVSHGSVTIGALVEIVTLFQLLAWPMRLIGFILFDLPRSVAGKERIDEVLAEPITLRPVEENLHLPPGPLGVSVEDVSFSYGPNPVLHDLSFEVRPNESVALVGPTGAGKSTLAQLLVRLDDPDEGCIRIGGVDLRHVSPDRLREAVSIVFQESFLFASAIRENITLGLDIPHEEVERAARLAQAHAFIERLPKGYDTVVGERGVTLSGGQRQRVALARALVRRPRVLILDDATSSVDPTVEAAILDGLRRELDTTLIVIAYRVSTISLADRVLFLDDGRVVASGTHFELLRHPAYDAMVRAYERGAA